MRVVSVPSLLLILPLTATLPSLSAQDFKLSPGRYALAFNPEGQGCPVDFSLRRNNVGALTPVPAAGWSGAVPAKRSVRFSLSSEQGKTITAADITLYAPRISNNATPATVVFGQTEGVDLIVKTYHVTQGEFSAGLFTGELDLLDTMAGVEHAAIRSLTYTDGTTWHPVDGVSCTATPPILMLVAQP